MEKVREGHIPIPWWAWVATGVVMAVYSKTVQVTNPDAAGILLFFYLGIIITIFGLGKLVIEKKQGEATKDVKKEEQRYGQQLQRQERQWQHQQPPVAQHAIIKCPQCGAQHYATSNFCHRCGARLR